MKKNATLFSAILMLTFFLSPMLSFAQQTDGEITEGREYWVGIPHCKMLEEEPIRGEVPIGLWISSKVDTRATISAPAINLEKTINITANEFTIFELGDELMNTESEVVKDYGIHVESEDPISLIMYLSYKWSGEAFRCIPIDWLGKKYVSCNMYQDKTDEYKPPQILIIAVEDGTTVRYYPTRPTEKVDAGSSGIATLDKGQTFLIHGRINKGLNQDWQTDITGTYIQSTKPIAVVSGHTKGAFPRYNSGMPDNYQLHWANFLRNMLTEMIWPIELLGTEYISAPIKYFNRPRNQTSVQDDEGDLIRFVAAYDDTELYQMRQDGSGLMKIGKTLDRGEWWNITNQEDAAYYKSTKPVLVCQYGKTWWSEDVPGREKVGKKDMPQNPQRNGQGMMLTLAPEDHWCSYANFRSPTNIDNFIYITFRMDDLDKLYYDGKKVTAKWGSSIVPIHGTEYAYITETIPAGDHYLEAVDGATFAAYAYGNWDKTKDGFAYGYPIGVNYASPCEDTLYVTDNIECGNVVGTAVVEATTDTADCASLFDVSVVSSRTENYDWTIEEFEAGVDTKCDYSLTVIDLKDTARAMVTFMSKSGKVVRKLYEYIPEQIKADPEKVDFGRLEKNETVCKNLILKNPIEQPLTIKSLRLKEGKPQFTLDTAGLLPVTLQQDEEISIEVCATAEEVLDQAVVDYVIAELSCFEEEVAELRFVTGEIICWIGDATWDPVPVGKERPKTVMIENRGTMPVELYSIEWEDKVHFTRVENLNFPLTLEKGNTHEFTVYYKPTEAGVEDYTRAEFEGNTQIEKLYSDWKGSGIAAGPVIEGYDWHKKRVIDEFATVTATEGYEGKIYISRVGNTDLNVQRIEIKNNDDGVFEIARNIDIPEVISGDDPIEIDAYFMPDEEKVYEREIILYSEFDGNEETAVATLKGIGTLPHVDIQGYDFEDPLLVGESADGTSKLTATVKSENPMDLTVFGLDITGPDANAFEIDQDWLDNNPFNWTLAPEEVVNIPVKFTAKHTGKHTAYIVPDDDASMEDPQAELTGYGYTEGLYAIPYDFGTIYKTTTAEGQVYVTNTGSSDIEIQEDLSITGADAASFEIISWYTENSGLNNPEAPFTLESGDKLFVDVRFLPDDVGAYEAKIVYHTTIGEAVSDLTGRGKEYKMVASIPTGKYETFPGGQQRIEFFISRNDEETKPIADANIRDFTARVTFKQSDLPNDLMIVYPKAENASEIYTNGTVINGWELADGYPKIVDNEYLEVRFTNDQPLDALGKLFEFDMMAYLSDESTVPLPCEFIPNGKPYDYVIVENQPGDMRIDPVCVQDLRLIVTTANKYALHDPAPNPVSDMTTIKYSVGIDATTDLALYNSFGEKITTLVAGSQKPGVYEADVSIDKLGLASGTYYIKLKHGPFEKVVPLVVVK